MAIERAGLTPKDIQFLIFATLSPDLFFPGAGVFVQEKLGMDTIGALDVRTQCRITSYNVCYTKLLRISAVSA